MTDVEKATQAIIATWAELHQYSKIDAINLIEMVYQCDRQQAEEFVFAVQCVNESAVPVERRRFDDKSHRASHKLLMKNKELEKQLIKLQKEVITGISWHN